MDEEEEEEEEGGIFEEEKLNALSRNSTATGNEGKDNMNLEYCLLSLTIQQVMCVCVCVKS